MLRLDVTDVAARGFTLEVFATGLNYTIGLGRHDAS